MSRILPISFNTDMVRAILDGRKTVTRRKMKEIAAQPYEPGDILYVREKFCALPVTPGGHMRGHDIYYYRADGDLRPEGWKGKWEPPTNMPKRVARIWLKVTDIRAERLQDLTVARAIEEGFGSREECITALKTIYPGSTDDTWLWVIEFERCAKTEPCILEGRKPAEKGNSCMGYGTAVEDEPCEMCKGCKKLKGEE